MSVRLHRLEIQNFKAFRDFTLNLEGRHLLLYGPNGSGKSSIYWALHAYLQSGSKNTESVNAYFDPESPSNLLNIFEQRADSPRPGHLAVTIKGKGDPEESHRIGYGLHETRKIPIVLRGDLASDFISYRFFAAFSHGGSVKELDLWPLFEKELMPWYIGTGSRNLNEWWRLICRTREQLDNRTSRRTRRADQDLEQQTSEFAGTLREAVETIGTRARQFYHDHFSSFQGQSVELRFELIDDPGYDSGTREFRFPVIQFRLEVDGHPISRPQVFLNEARLTQVALSIRLAVSLVKLRSDDLRLLVLDDLLVSLEMSNRMKVVEILLSEEFSGYQKIILTHDLGFFREFRRAIGSRHAEWSFVRLDGSPMEGPKCNPVKSDFQRVEDYIAGHDLEAASVALRKVTEETVKRYLGRDGVVDPTKAFSTLRRDLKSARNRLQGEMPVEVYERIVRNTPSEHRNLLIATGDDDLDNNTSLDRVTRGRLKTNRSRLRTLVMGTHVERLRKIALIDEVLLCLERVLNPAAHVGDAPLHLNEVEKAVQLVAQLQEALTPT